MSKVPYAQDLPPAGGFSPIKYQRNLPVRGPGGALIFGAVAAICTFGFWRVGQGNLEKRELQREKAWSRIHLVPLLLAESDRDVYRREQAALAREKEIMKDVPGWEAGAKAYHSKRYTPSTVVVI
ncbi:GRIM-19 [Meredithblackwellia eburnea MCA 4105]